MSSVPLGAPLAQPAVGKPYGTRLLARYKDLGGLQPPGLVAEEIARRWGLSREMLDDWAKQSRQRALTAESRPPAFLVPVAVKRESHLTESDALPAKAHRKARAGEILVQDEALLRPSVDISRLRPAYLTGGVVTAANMAAEGDGASAVVLCAEGAMDELGLVPKARVLAFATVASDPLLWPLAAVPATVTALQRAGFDLGDIDNWYVHESSSAAILAWAKETGLAMSAVNVNGGALAVTAPVGAVGAGLFSEAVAGLSRGRNGTALVCTAGEGGIGTACVLGPPA